MVVTILRSSSCDGETFAIHPSTKARLERLFSASFHPRSRVFFGRLLGEDVAEQPSPPSPSLVRIVLFALTGLREEWLRGVVTEVAIEEARTGQTLATHPW